MHVVDILHAIEKLTQDAHQLLHTRTAAKPAIEYALDAQRWLNLIRLPTRWNRTEQIVLAVALTIQLADILGLGSTELLDNQVGVFTLTVRVRLIVAPRITRRLGCFCKAVLADGAPDMMRLRGGNQRRQ